MGDLRGPVEITPPLNATPEQIAQTKAYVDGSNQALQAGKLSPMGRVSIKGSLRISANSAVAKERARADAAGTPYKGQVGHVPDTTWTGSADPYSWLDIDPLVNMSIGGQANRYPVGYKPTEFRYKDRG
jgi:toxin YxiD